MEAEAKSLRPPFKIQTMNTVSTKNKYGILTALLLFISTWASAQTPTFFWDQNNTGTNSIPLGGGTWADQRNQWLYPPGDFGNVPGGRGIWRIWLKAGTGTYAAADYANFVVRMGQPNNLSGGLPGTWITGLQTVLSRSVYTIPATTPSQWFAIDLDIPFPYDPSLPLIVETIQTGTTGSKPLAAGGVPTNTAWTGNTQAYGASAAAAPTSRRYSYAFGFEARELAPINAGARAITEPSNFCPGTYAVKTQIQNLGTKQLDSVRVSWSLDGAFQGTFFHTTMLDTFGGAGNNTAIITLGNVTWNAGQTRVVKAWTSFPNGIADTTNNDDTVTANLKPALSGTFTVGGSGADYPNLAAAANDLSANGICGPVVLNVAAGTYVGQVSFDGVAGASATNSITVLGSGVNNTFIEFNPNTTANQHVIRISNTSYVTIKHMTIRSTSATAAFGVHITGNSFYNLIDSNVITINTSSTSTAFIGVTISGATYSAATTAAFNIISNNFITGGYNGVSMYGNSGSPARGNQVLNNTIRSSYYAGVWIYFQSYVTVRRNDIRTRFSTTDYGLYLYYLPDSAVADGNICYSRYMGIYLSQMGTTGTLKSFICNNFTYGHTNSTSYGLYLTGCSRTAVFNNSSIIQTTAGAALYQTGGSGCEIYNNIFTKTTSGTLTIQALTASGISYMDYNNYFDFGGAGNFANFSGQIVGNFQALKGIDPGYHQNCLSENPRWVNITPGMENMHISSSLPSPRGIALIANPFDIDGDPRCEFAPTIGADENTSSLPAPIANFGVMDTVFTNAPGTIVSTSYITPGDRVAYHWYLDGVEIGTEPTLRHRFPASGSYDVKLVVNSCGSADSVTKLVTVVDPTAVPVTNFTASHLVLDPLQYTTLTDISTGGPDAWTWDFPNALGTVVQSDQYGPTNSVAFIDPGEYEVCLTTENQNGAGNQECKSAYIYVRESFWFCSASVVSARAGRLFDESGGSSNYSNNTNCSLLIDPCASSVSLKFSTFQVADAGDILYIYDGQDAQTGTLIGAYSNTSGLPGGNIGLTANSGKMFLVWTTNASGVAAGFDAEWNSISTTVNVPNADFTYPAVTYTGEIINFSSTSTGANLRYSWDFDPPMNQAGLDGGRGANDRYSFPTAGVYPVRLTASNCAGTSDITKNITIVDPSGPPIVGFTASTLKSKVEKYITFTDTSQLGPNGWFWRITPNSGVFYRNNVRNTKQVEAIFYRPGFYNVELVVTNIKGKDSLTKSNYIEIVDYCSPAVNALNTDAGMSYFEFAGVGNASEIGVTPYTNYSLTLAPIKVEQGKTYNFSMSRNTTVDDMSRKIWVDWNNDGDFNDAGEEVAYEAPARTTNFSGSILIPRSAIPGITRMRVGASYRSGQNVPCGINPTGEFEDYAIDIIPDVIAPVVTLLGRDTVSVEQWHQYVEPGFTASDNIDGVITANVQISSNVNTSVVGTYQVNYNVLDSAGNPATQKVRIVIVTPDVTLPVLTLLGSTPMKHTVYTAFVDPGYTAIDFDTRNLTSNVVVQNNINENALGLYDVIYTIDDGSGNIDSKVRQVEVVDDVAPLVVFTDPTNPVIMEVNAPFVEPGVTISDNYDRAPIISTSGLDVTKTGTYQLVYIGSDSSGNISAPLVRTVIVQDSEAPVIDLVGGDTVFVNVFAPYNERGFVATDNYCENLNVVVTGKVNVNVVGTYVLTYNLTDCEGNAAITRTRVVIVVDREAPELTLKGLPSVNIVRWQGFNDPGVSISDNYYTETELQALLQVTGNLDENWEGEYEVCYQVTDPSGNRSSKVCRAVTVLENLTSVGDVNGTQLKAYPNPTTGLVKFDADFSQNEVRVVEVMDLSGKQLLTIAPYQWQNAGATIDLSGLNSGLYLIRYHGAKTTWTTKVELIK